MNFKNWFHDTWLEKHSVKGHFILISNLETFLFIERNTQIYLQKIIISEYCKLL